MKRFAVYVLTTCVLIGFLQQHHIAGQINTVKELAPGVYFHEGDLRRKGHCNNGWDKELSGNEFPKKGAMEDARRAHQRHHGSSGYAP